MPPDIASERRHARRREQNTAQCCRHKRVPAPGGNERNGKEQRQMRLEAQKADQQAGNQGMFGQKQERARDDSGAERAILAGDRIDETGGREDGGQGK